jgi:hypothetical protein
VISLGEFSSIGRLFTLGSVLKSRVNFWAVFSTVPGMHYLTKNDWATFWAAFSQAHLVTLDNILT